MDKKIFDIIPPKEKPFSRPTVYMEEKKEIPKKVKAPLKTNIPKVPILKILSIIFVLLLAVGGISFLFFSETKIDIWPETEILILTDSIAISLDDTGIISGQIFKDQKSKTQDFSASGIALKEEKAEGIIKVYNNYSTSSQPLLINTRFVSTDGKMFRSVQREVVAGGTYEKGKLVPGETDIKVKAAEPGESYNIEASTFSIPGFAGTPKYTAFYGKSFSPMTNGFKDEVAQITQDDLDKAEISLIEELKRESRDLLKTALPEDFVLLEETISQEITEKNFSEKAGKKADSFSFQSKVESEALIFKKSDLESFAKDLINSSISDDKRFQDETLEINYSPEISEEEVVLNIEIKAKIYQDIDMEELKKNLSGKPFQEVELFLKDQSWVSRVEIEKGPLWRMKVPESLKKVEMKLNLD